MDSQGPFGVGRGVYNPCFLTVGFAMAQAVLIRYICRRLVGVWANKNTSAKLPLSSQYQSALPLDYNVPPKSSWHARLKEHRDGPGGIEILPKDEINHWCTCT